MHNIGSRLQQLRKKAVLTQRQIGDYLGICDTGYSYYERKFSVPPIEKLLKLATLYHTTIQYIVKGEEPSIAFDEHAVTPFPQRLQELRKERNITQAAAAAHLHVAEVTYQRYEYGDFEPKLDKLLKLTELFGVTLDELLGRNKR